MGKISLMVVLVLFVIMALLFPFYHWISQFKDEALQQQIACIYAVTAILSFCSFCAVLYTSHSQSMELKRYREVQEQQKDYNRLNALTILNDYYRTENERQLHTMASLSQMEGLKKAEERYLDTLELLTETRTEIKKYHSTLCTSMPVS